MFSIFDSNKKIKYIYLFDRTDRLGSNISWYVSTILVAIKNNYKIRLIKPKRKYRYYNSIFIESLLDFVEEYNEKNFGNKLGNEIIIQNQEYFRKIIESILDIKLDFVTAFKKYVFTEYFKKKLNELAKRQKYTIPYDTEKTIVVHLRLDDVKNKFITNDDRTYYSMKFKKIINSNNINYVFPGYAGQSAIKEDQIKEIIEKALTIYKDYEVIIITNGSHTLPYKTICTNDESYDLFLLCSAKVLIGSMSTYSFASILFGNHTSIYYPVWDASVCFGLTTKYDKNTIINYF